jgi:hypothetical protein
LLALIHLGTAAARSHQARQIAKNNSTISTAALDVDVRMPVLLWSHARYAHRIGRFGPPDPSPRGGRANDSPRYCV